MYHLPILLAITLAIGGMYFLSPAFLAPYKGYALALLGISFVYFLGRFLLLVAVAFSGKNKGTARQQ